MKKDIKSFFRESKKWSKEYAYLREIVLATDLKEKFKWGKPCYTHNGDNIVLIHGFKEYCALLFHKGALLKDTDDILIQQTENVQSARQIRFTNVKEIQELESSITSYLYEAIEVEKAGLEVEMKKTSEYEMVEELEEAFEQDADLKAAFKNLTPGRQRGYLLYFSAAKQSKTRKSRIVKAAADILKGKGLNDR